MLSDDEVVPGPRPEVVELLERMIRDYAESGYRAVEWTTRTDWSTGAERKLAVAAAAAKIRAEFAAYWAAADQQDAEHRGSVSSDEQFLRDAGISR